MTSWKPAILAVVLALHANAQEGSSLEKKCDANSATYCYWQLAWRYGASHLIRREDVKTSFLVDICVTEAELPKGPVCKQYYQDCVEAEKQNFTAQELGYSMLQEAVTNNDTCADATDLAACISSDIDNCPVFFYMAPTASNANNNYEAAKKLRSCIKDALGTCSGCDKEYLSDYIDTIAEALTYLYRDYSSPMPSTLPTPPTTLGTKTNGPTHEASPTAANTVSPTTKCIPEETSEGPTTTAKPEPTTTPAPSSALTIVPQLGAFGIALLISMV